MTTHTHSANPTKNAAIPVTPASPSVGSMIPSWGRMALLRCSHGAEGRLFTFSPLPVCLSPHQDLGPCMDCVYNLMTTWSFSAPLRFCKLYSPHCPNVHLLRVQSFSYKSWKLLKSLFLFNYQRLHTNSMHLSNTLAPRPTIQPLPNVPEKY